MTPIPILRRAGGPRYPLVTVASQADRSGLLRDVAAALELHGVPCPFIAEILEGAADLDGEDLDAYLRRWVQLR